MPTQIDSNQLKELSNPTPTTTKVVDETEGTLQSFERIAQRVENIMTILERLKKTAKPPKPNGVATKIEAGINKQVVTKIEETKKKAEIKIDVDGAKEQIKEFLETLSDEKTIKQIKGEVKEMEKLKQLNFVIEDFISRFTSIIFV